MAQPDKVCVFLGAPPACSSVQSMDQEDQGLSMGWASVRLEWSEGRLQPSTDVSNSQVSAAATVVLPSVSVHEYLDLSFPDSLGSDLAPKPGSNCPSLSVQAEHLCTWTLSQALVLRGKREPPTPERWTSLSSTPELFSPQTLLGAPRVQEEGVILEVTSDGLLCSQDIEPPTPPVGVQHSCPGPAERVNSCGSPTTLLSWCRNPTVRYTILVAVVHPCYLKEVKARSGLPAGALIPMASIVVTDQSDMEMKVVLWRRAAFWVMTVQPGDILMISGLQVNEDRWREEMILQSTFSSELLNLGQVPLASCPSAPRQVQLSTLEALCAFLRQQRPLLLSLPLRRPQDLARLPYASLWSLCPNTLVHARLRVAHCYTCTEWKPEAESRSRSARQQSAVVRVEQHGGQEGTLVLWGAATSWVQRFDTNKGTNWDVRFLLVREGPAAGLHELHSTPWSSARPHGASDPQLQDSRGLNRSRVGAASLELDIRTLLSQKYSGEVMLQVQVLWFQFQQSIQSCPQPVLSSSTSLAGVVAALRGDITYIGCARCGSELNTDVNAIFRACYPCLPFTSIRTFYRPAVVMLGAPDEAQVCVQVPPRVLQNILVASPQKIGWQSGSDESICMAAEKIQNLVDLPKKTFSVTLQSRFMCDENSVTISQEFTLLHMEPLESTTFT